MMDADRERSATKRKFNYDHRGTSDEQTSGPCLAAIHPIIRHLHQQAPTRQVPLAVPKKKRKMEAEVDMQQDQPMEQAASQESDPRYPVLPENFLELPEEKAQEVLLKVLVTWCRSMKEDRATNENPFKDLTEEDTNKIRKMWRKMMRMPQWFVEYEEAWAKKYKLEALTEGAKKMLITLENEKRWPNSEDVENEIKKVKKSEKLKKKLSNRNINHSV